MSRRAERRDLQVRWDQLAAVCQLSGRGMAAVDWLHWSASEQRFALVEVVSQPFAAKDGALERLVRKFSDSLHALACVRAGTSWGAVCGGDLPTVFGSTGPGLLVVVQLSGPPPLDQAEVLSQALRFVLPLHGLRPTAVAVLTRQLAERAGLPIDAP
ncbi:MAG: hypothetical protein IT204_16740 [Fimbriimonadaceae bacterium]|nr:hypothetical protein [Fimbriimonadaceae bacterium]